MDKKKKIIIISIICAGVVILGILISTIFALLNVNNTRMMSGVKIQGMNVSGLTKEEAIQTVKKNYEEKFDLVDMMLTVEEEKFLISPTELDASFDIKTSVENAYKIGRDGNILKNNYTIIFTMFMGKEITPAFLYDVEKLDKLIVELDKNLPNHLIENAYYIEDDDMIITRGKPGNVIKTDELQRTIISKLGSLDYGSPIEIPIEIKDPGEIDIEKIYEEIYTEPKDAYYTKGEKFQIFPHINGIKFDLELAKQQMTENKSEYKIPLIITVPEITTNKIGTEAFPDLLASFSTKYDASNRPRSENLRLAASKINGTVLLPGDTFSYNKVVGERTIAAGYKEAKIYEAGRVVDGLGGGICQISSTLYNTVVFANLDIVERHNHQFVPSYVGAGRDATVVYGAKDFKFINSRTMPIKIVASVQNGVAKIDVYGMKEEVEYQINIQTSIVSSIAFKTIRENDSSLANGTEQTVQKGQTGYKSAAYKVKKLNGTVVESKLLSTDTYNPMHTIIKVGTKSGGSTTPSKPSTPSIPVENPPDPPKPPDPPEPPVDPEGDNP